VSSFDPGAARGFSLIELLIASAITIVVTALASGLAVEAFSSWRSESARIDLHQRARVAADVLTRALLEAGVGPHGGPARGPLTRSIPGIVPRRIGRRDGDAFNVVRTDGFTTLRAVGEAEHGTLMVPASAGTATAELAPSAACALPACGFAEGTNAALLDVEGWFDVFSVLSVTGQTLALRHHGMGSARDYPAGSPVLAFEPSTYYLDRDTRALRRYDGDASDLPVVDDVVDLRVEYYGDIRPPLLPRPPLGTANCLYESDGTYRTAALPVLPNAGGGQAVLTTALLSDGPWCGAGGTRFDADVFRIRRVRVTVRLQAGDPAVRGADAVLFFEPGFATRSSILVPDMNLVLDLSPRNLRATW
jgi:prepilin-type N-terminal cleavage/methylation domain-containing protein